MKRSIATNVAVFNTNRMVREYAEVSYLPSFHRSTKLSADKCAAGKILASWRRKILDGWKELRVEEVTAPPPDALHVGDQFPVQVRVNLGRLSPQDVEVQLYHGVVNSIGEISAANSDVLMPIAGTSNPSTVFGGSVSCTASGQYGFSVRVLPRHVDLPSAFEPGLVTWG